MIKYSDRNTKQMREEKVYGAFFLEILYGKGPLAFLLRPLFARIPFFSRLYGLLQKRAKSRKKVLPFIREYEIDTTEFVDPPENFSSFNAFFTRRLKKKARPIAKGEEVAVMPADGRYLFYPDVSKIEGIWVKGKVFSLDHLLEDAALAKSYEKGAMVIARLCPVDYHRFHFPVSGVPSKARLINGPLYSVNPIALKKNITYLAENKRYITEIESKKFGKVLFIEVGATNVGTVMQTYIPGRAVEKGDEKGFFSFGGSCIILLFEEGRITFDRDLLELMERGCEIYCQMGQSLCKSGTS